MGVKSRFKESLRCNEKPSDPPRRGGRVLYVDDEEALKLLARRVLERLGFQVTATTDPAEAVRLFASRPADFDAVVTDLAMPVMSGFECAKAMLAVRPDVPIILTSGFLRPEDERRALELGIREVIPKPSTMDKLGCALERLLAAPRPPHSR